MSEDDRKNIGRIALQQRALSPEQIEATMTGSRGEEAAARRPDEVGQLKTLSEKYGIPAIDLRQLCLRLDDLELIPREIARRHVILPVLVKEDQLFVAMANPQDKKVVDELEFVTDKKVYPYVALRETLESVIEEAYTLQTRDEPYYVGPDCPPDVLKKIGLYPGSSAPDPMESQLPDAAERGSERRDSLPIDEAGVVVDDAVDRLSRSDDIADEDFGDVSKELSVVTDIPESELGSAPIDAKLVLVVDDEEEIRSMIERLLRGKGFRVLGTDNGRAALKLVKEHNPDLIVLDAMLPEVHGFEIARRIKGSKRYGHIPIIMVSAVYRGWRYAEDLRESCGVEHYVEKPFRIADVLEAVDSALSKEAEPSSSRSRAISEEAERELNAGVSAYQEGRIDDAVRHLRRGVEIDPLAYRLHFHLGLLYGKKGLVYEAIGELERAVEINSRHFPAVKNLAILYQKAGFRNKATEMWERALNVAPDDDTRQSIKQHLLSLL